MLFLSVGIPSERDYTVVKRGENMDRVIKIKKMYSIFSVGLIALGALFLFKPTMTAEVFCKIGGVFMLFFGAVKLYSYFSKDILQLAFQFDFAMGILSALLGIVMLSQTTKFLDLIVVCMGLFMLVDALLRMQTAMDAWRIGVKRWRMILVFALLVALAGAMLFLRPYEGRNAIVMLMGINLIIDGVLNLYVVQNTVSILRR